MRKLLVVLVVLVLLGVAGDRVADKLATDEAEKRLAANGLTSPDVEVAGFPFLTQLLSRHFDEVQVSSPLLRVSKGQAEEVSATGHDVQVPSGGQVVVGRLTAQGTITYAEVLGQSGQRGLRLSKDNSGGLQLRRDVTVLGRTYAVIAHGRVKAHGREVRVVPTSFRLDGGGALDRSLEEELAGQFSLVYTVQGLPDGIEIRRIAPAQDGFVVDVTGRDVRLSSSSSATG